MRAAKATPGQRAMMRSRHSEAKLARLLNLSPATLRRCLRHGFPSYNKAVVAAAHLGCGVSEVAPFATLLEAGPLRGDSRAAQAAPASGCRRGD